MSWLLDQLRRFKEDRGMMANLRCSLVAGKKQRAWPALNRLGLDLSDKVSAVIAGLYATHPEETNNGNFGVTCKAIEKKPHDKPGDKKETKLTPIERRFQHLLASEPGDELFGRVIRLVIMAKAQGIPINFEKLRTDLKFWNERTKIEWARSFWDVGESTVIETEGEAS